ncbi:MAG: hypothetical protein RBU30_00355, partial [Polyangia bacterium]|nr:hypothetical protein [Polyangia bacterium]
PETSRPAAEQLYAIPDAVEAVKAASQAQLVAESHRHPISRKLETIPGMGQVRVAQAARGTAFMDMCMATWYAPGLEIAHIPA